MIEVCFLVFDIKVYVVKIVLQLGFFVNWVSVVNIYQSSRICENIQ